MGWWREEGVITWHDHLPVCISYVVVGCHKSICVEGFSCCRIHYAHSFTDRDARTSTVYLRNKDTLLLLVLVHVLNKTT